MREIRTIADLTEAERNEFSITQEMIDITYGELTRAPQTPYEIIDAWEDYKECLNSIKPVKDNWDDSDGYYNRYDED